MHMDFKALWKISCKLQQNLNYNAFLATLIEKEPFGET